MDASYNKKLINNARRLRRNMTKEERHLWYDFLKELPVMVHRQRVIGNYIADFYIAQSKLVIELDGSQHYENPDYDIDRDGWLKSQGYQVLHIPNNAIWENFSGVCEAILQHIQPSSVGEGGSPKG